MKKTITIGCSIILAFLILIGLLFHLGLIRLSRQKSYSGKDYDLYTVGKLSVPMGVLGESWSRTEIIEEDSYGRRLFLYDAVSVYWPLGEYHVYAYVICQKTEDGKTGFYEDIAYVAAAAAEDITEEEIEILKEKNDWDKPLVKEKMWFVEIADKDGSLKYYPYIEELREEKIREILQIDKEHTVYLAATAKRSNNRDYDIVLEFDQSDEFVCGYIVHTHSKSWVSFSKSDRYALQEKMIRLKEQVAEKTRKMNKY